MSSWPLPAFTGDGRRAGNASGDRVETAPNSYMRSRGSGLWASRRLSGPSMLSVIIVIHLMIVLAMVGLILLQKSEGGGLGMGSSGGGGFLSTRGSTNVLTRTTAILAAVFFATSLILSMIAGMDRKPRSVLT